MSPIPDSRECCFALASLQNRAQQVSGGKGTRWYYWMGVPHKGRAQVGGLVVLLRQMLAHNMSRHSASVVTDHVIEGLNSQQEVALGFMVCWDQNMLQSPTDMWKGGWSMVTPS